MKGFVSLVLATVLGGFLASTAQADPNLERRIKNKAMQIYDAVSYTDASWTALQEALEHMDRALRLIEDARGRHDLMCEPRDNLFSYVTRVFDGYRLGGSEVRHETCQQIIANSRNGLVCAPDRTQMYAFMMDIATGTTLGNASIRYDECFNLVKSSTPQLACSPSSAPMFSFLYSLERRQPLGFTHVRTDLCRELIANSTPNWVCSPDQSSFYAYITRIETGEMLGSALNYQDCYGKIRTLP